MNLSPQASRLLSVVAPIVPRNSYDTGKVHVFKSVSLEIGGTKGDNGGRKGCGHVPSFLRYVALRRLAAAARETVNPLCLR